MASSFVEQPSFSWRAFLLGFLAGAFAVVVAIAVALAALVFVGIRMANTARTEMAATAIPAPRFPTGAQLSVYGQPDRSGRSSRWMARRRSSATTRGRSSS